MGDGEVIIVGDRVEFDLSRNLGTWDGKVIKSSVFGEIFTLLTGDPVNVVGVSVPNVRSRVHVGSGTG